MRINSVRATAFGPLRGQTLDLAPGLNVVHGPNEAGKSSWFAATYAGLAGRRKAKGRGTASQAEFAKRHSPWSGTQWSAGVTVTLDNGLVLAMEHDLRKGESRIVDGSSRRPISIADLERLLGIGLTTDNTLDGTRLLGLNRDSARATVFTGQADILRVLEHADELQEYLERAASTEAADATAEGALTWLAAWRSERVGSPSLGAKPLRALRLARERARLLTTERRDGLIRLVEVIARRRQIGAELEQARKSLDLADRFSRWQAVYELRGRLAQAVELTARLADSARIDLAVDEEKVRTVAAVLGAFEAGSDVLPLPPGPSAADLQAEIDALPERPDGDLEPRPEVDAAFRELSRAQTALTTHLGDAPSEDRRPGQSALSSDELRALADAIEAPPPVVDTDLVAELASLKQEAEDAAVAYADAVAAAKQRNEEKERAHAAAVQQHAEALSEFERVQAERTAAYEALRQVAEDATIAYTVAQAAYDTAIQRNEEKLRAHAAAVQEHTQTLAAYERLQAERTAAYESLRQEAEDSAAGYADAKAAFHAATQRNEERLRAHAAAVQEHTQALAEYERLHAERTAAYESLQREAEEAAARYASAQAAYEAAARRNEEKLRAHAAAMQEHTQALAEYARAQTERNAQLNRADHQSPQRSSARRRSVALVVAGVALLVVGTVLTAVGPVVPGIVTATLGGALGIAGVLVRRAPAGPPTPTDDDTAPDNAPEPPAAPELEEVRASAAPLPDPRLAEVQAELRAKPPAAPEPPQLEEATAPVAPEPDPQLVEIQVELRAKPPAAPEPPQLEEATAPVAPEADPRLASLKADLKAQPPAAPLPHLLEDVHAIVAPQPDPRLKEVEIELKAQETAVRQHAAHVASAQARLLAESLDPAPSSLRLLARAMDDADAAQQRAQAHAAKTAALRATRDEAARRLARTLGQEIGANLSDETVDHQIQAFEAYVAACRERAEVAKLAGRRPDLVATQHQRRQSEITHAAAVAERDGQVRALRDLANGLGAAPESSTAETAEHLRQWISAQEHKREAQASRRELTARLDQLLASRDLEDWQAELATLEAGAGVEPAEVPVDVEQFRAAAVTRHQAVLGRAGQLEGQQQQLSQSLGSVAEAVEQEAEAERAAAQVETLASCIDTAAEQLKLAKDRAHASIAPALEARMRPWFPRVTIGRYLDVAVEPEHLTMRVTEASGAVRHADLLSHGTTEQLFLLLRVTLSQVLSGDRETAPLILDDVTVQSDHARTMAIMALLHEISADHQVLLFTQEQDVVAWADESLDDSRDKLIPLPAPR